MSLDFESFRLYPGTAYGFCEFCRKTDIPVMIEKADGTLDMMCPTCAEDECDDAEPIAEEMCAHRGCRMTAVTLCGKCGDALCSTHESAAGFCDVCSPSPYRYGWSGRFESGFDN